MMLSGLTNGAQSSNASSAPPLSASLITLLIRNTANTAPAAYARREARELMAMPMLASTTACRTALPMMPGSEPISSPNAASRSSVASTRPMNRSSTGTRVSARSPIESAASLEAT